MNDTIGQRLTSRLDDAPDWTTTSTQGEDKGTPENGSRCRWRSRVVSFLEDPASKAGQALTKYRAGDHDENYLDLDLDLDLDRVIVAIGDDLAGPDHDNEDDLDLLIANQSGVRRTIVEMAASGV